MIKILNTKGNTGYELMHGYYDVLAELQDNCTNGDMIKAVFPNIDASVSGEGDVIDVYELGIYCQTFDLDWWKAPYGRG